MLKSRPCKIVEMSTSKTGKFTSFNWPYLSWGYVNCKKTHILSAKLNICCVKENLFSEFSDKNLSMFTLCLTDLNLNIFYPLNY
jgi:hypothetical protein